MSLMVIHSGGYHLFEELPDTPFKEYPELLQALLPWSVEVQENCK